MNLQEEVGRIVKLPDVRSADRANMQRMLELLKRGRPLSYQDRQNLWAYISRYSSRR